MPKLLVILVLATLACGTQVQLVTVTPSASPLATRLGPKMVENTIVPTQGHALGSVEIRNTPEANGDPSWNVGYLANGDPVQEIECLSVGNAVWVRHAAGWSVVRNLGGVYISGVCLPRP